MSAGFGFLFLFLGAVLGVAPLPVYLYRWLGKTLMPKFRDTPGTNLPACMVPTFFASGMLALLSSLGDQLVVIVAPILLPLLTGWTAIPFWIVFGVRKGFQAPIDPKALRKYALAFLIVGLALAGIGLLFFGFGEPIDWK